MLPFFDPNRDYDDNCENGPFASCDNSDDDFNTSKFYDFLGIGVRFPFGIPAGPLPNSRFIKFAFDYGFDLPYYKTVRTREYSCAKFPNVIPVDVLDNLTLENAKKGVFANDDFNIDFLAITNSFGVPSQDPNVWQQDMEKAVKSAKNGQVMIASFQGTDDKKGFDTFMKDNVLASKLVKETGAKIIEMNLSCPNEGKNDLLCFDTDAVEKISDKIKNEIGNIPLLLKISFFENNDNLRDFVFRLSKIVDGFSAINTIAAKVKNKDGSQALPGKGRLISGVCGSPIKWAGLDMTKRLSSLRKKLKKKFAIVGTGGVSNCDDFDNYRENGADAVMSASFAMWNCNLAKEIRNEYIKENAKK